MKVSDITVEYLKNYFKIDYNDDDELIGNILEGGKAYISSYTGLSIEEMELKQDLGIALTIICSEMYDNRQFTVDSDKVNPIVTSILSMYSINLL